MCNDSVVLFHLVHVYVKSSTTIPAVANHTIFISSIIPVISDIVQEVINTKENKKEKSEKHKTIVFF